MNENKSSILDVLSGNESVKVSVGLDWMSVIILYAAIVAAGATIVFLNKRIK